MSEPFKRMDGMVWILPDGPNTEAYPLACFVVNDITKPRGDNTPFYCQDPSGPGRYLTKGKSKSPPGLATLSLEGYIETRFEEIENLICQSTVIITQTKSGRKDRITNWDRSWIVPGFDITNETISNLVGRDSDDPSMMSFDANANDIYRLIPFRVYRQSTSQTTAINSIFACDEDICQSEFGVRHRRGDTLYAVTDAVAGSAVGTANVLYKDSDAETSTAWTAIATDPFGTSEHILAGVCFAIDNDTSRILVFLGVTDAGNPAECSYIDRTNGVFGTWTSANIGTVNGEFVSSSKAAFALDDHNIWVGTNLGRIYFSEDGGVTWTLQENAAIHAADWSWVQFIDDRTGFAGGDADVVAITVDGGVTWSQMTATGGGDNIVTGGAFNPNQLWVGTSGGDLYFSNDGALTWDARTFAGTGVGTIDDMSWLNDHIGMISHRSAAPVSTVYMTKDGGKNWESLTTLTNVGLNKVFMVSNRLAYACGEVSGGTGVIFRMNPA